ncbi:MAG: T9SS type A sorting domain-containing protein [Saprospiraceae bacterium]|nr:T9SS type A sorting domain-containing protein [Saprospiraceae bacterium]
MCTNVSALRFILLTLAGLLASLAVRGQTNTVTGRITTPVGEPMRGVVVNITGSTNSFTITDSAGFYQAALPTGGTYTLTPFSDNNDLNGVSTLDLFLLTDSGHLNTPYLRIAADADNNGIIDLADSLEIRKIILAINLKYPQNTSWRFVQAAYQFPDPENPFSPPYPESFTIPNLTANTVNIDFIGMKIGDLNYTAALVNLTDSAHLAWIDGTVVADANSDCAVDTTETPLVNWMAKAEGSFGVFYGKTNASGQFTITAPPGTYDVSLLPPNDYWAPCTSPLTGVSANLLAHTAVEFPVQAVVECPYMTVDLSAFFLRRCFGNTYYVKYCNLGTTAADNASVTVTFDDELAVQTSSIPWASVSGNSYTFPLGTVPANYCGQFYVTVLVDCDAVPGETHCSSAQIYPDTSCGIANPLWNGANLVVTGECLGNQVVFSVQNTGAPMTTPTDYVVIEDIMIEMHGAPIQLGTGQSEVVAMLPANGSTWRVEVDQPAFHPWGNVASASVEGCGTNTTGTFTTGLVSLFPLGDESPTFDSDCQINIASYDPNDKQGYPLGVDAAHYVPRGQEISYKIRFQNTGTDTAFNIVVLDTLSAMLDLATFRPGSSSHPYSYNILGEGVLQFVFQNILLPDSNVNEAASHGFVQFIIKPRADLANNAVIENAAAIFFDFNDPVITNRTWHTFGEKYLNASQVVFQPGLELLVSPNPATDRVQFSLQSPRNLEGRLLLFDSQGRQVREQAFPANTFELRVADLSTGLYFFRLESEGRVLAAGKLGIE